MRFYFKFKGVIPIIRCEKGSVAEAVAVKLDSKLRDYILNAKSSISSDLIGQSLSRPSKNYSRSFF